jgi:hypothetical protein
MKTVLIALAAAAAVLSGRPAFAQSASFGSIGLLAMNAVESRGDSRARGALVDTPDAGGGLSAGRAARGTDAPARTHTHDDDAAIDAPGLQPGDPSTPVAPTPKRPSYRWQSLVPGAIK